MREHKPGTVAVLLAQQRPARRDRHRPRTARSARTTRPALPTSCWKRRSPRSWTARIRSPRSMPQDKVAVYRNWLGLMKGDLDRGGRQGRQDLHAPPQPGPRLSRRRMARTLTLHGPLADAGAQCRAPDDQPGDPRRATGSEVPEGIMDAMVTALIALHDIGPNGRRANSRAGSIYIVKPKMHGPDEVAFADRDCSAASKQVLGLAAQHAEDGHHGRGAAHHRQPQGMHPRGEGRASSSSTPASSTAPATRSTPRWKPGR